MILGAISESTAGVLGEDIAGGIGMIVLIVLIAIAAAMFIASGSKTATFAYLEKEQFETKYKSAKRNTRICTRNIRLRELVCASLP